ncbi:alpha/beta fold hydrolase [Bacteriovoracales bacterium]|nr:alpha/beta fold hydrolase [Bacteriovoracales bacterium]
MKLKLSGPFILKTGEKIKRPHLFYKWEGDKDLPVIVVLGGISSDSLVSGEKGWWKDFVGPNGSIDTKAFSILSFDFLGGNGKSSGPRNSKEKMSIHTEDQAKALRELIKFLGIKVHTFVGSSYGGMVGLAFASLYPDLVEKLLVISASHYPNTRSIALRSLQRQMVSLGRSKKLGLAQARSLAMIGYRSVEELESRFGRKKSEKGEHFLVEDYLKAKGQEFSERFHPDAFLNLSESIDLHFVEPKTIRIPSTFIGVDSDQLVFSKDIKRLSQKIKAPSTFYEIKSLFGHDAFLKEVEVLGNIIKKELAR